MGRQSKRALVASKVGAALWRIESLYRSFVGKLFVIGWSLGSITVVLGLRAEATYWAHHPFQMNLFSALTGFCFGVPVLVAIVPTLATAVDTQRRESTLNAWRKDDPRGFVTRHHTTYTSGSSSSESFGGVGTPQFLTWLERGHDLGALRAHELHLLDIERDTDRRRETEWRANTPAGDDPEQRKEWLERGLRWLTHAEFREWYESLSPGRLRSLLEPVDGEPFDGGTSTLERIPFKDSTISSNYELRNGKLIAKSSSTLSFVSTLGVWQPDAAIETEHARSSDTPSTGQR
jgi:hypothetical protein